jgi:putative transcriptional regulator
MTEYLLRDMKRNTELLILAEFLKDPSVKRKDIAERLGVTEQAISQYIGELEREHLLTTVQGRLKPSRKGVQLLQERFLQLNDEIKGILRQIQVIDTCVALAAGPIRAKDRVGLVMREGRLVALPNKSAGSSGIARNSADKGDEVMVGGLEGVVELDLGELLILQVPSEASGGSKKADLSLATKAMKGFHYDEVAVGDLVGEVVAKRLHLSPTLMHAPVEATMNALSKGLDVLFLGTHDSTEEVNALIERLKSQSGYAISFKLAYIGKER